MTRLALAWIATCALAMCLLTTSGCTPKSWDLSEWELAPGLSWVVDNAVELKTGKENNAITLSLFGKEFTVFTNDDDEGVKVHERIHREQADAEGWWSYTKGCASGDWSADPRERQAVDYQKAALLMLENGVPLSEMWAMTEESIACDFHGVCP